MFLVLSYNQQWEFNQQYWDSFLYSENFHFLKMLSQVNKFEKIKCDVIFMIDKEDTSAKQTLMEHF